MKKVLIQIIRWYQAMPISTHLYCRFQPTCSQYMIDAINEYGCWHGVWMGIKRIIRCNPFSKPGYDPVVRRQI